MIWPLQWHSQCCFSLGYFSSIACQHYNPIVQWGSIRCKHNFRWMHLSQMKDRWVKQAWSKAKCYIHGQGHHPRTYGYPFWCILTEITFYNNYVPKSCNCFSNILWAIDTTLFQASRYERSICIRLPPGLERPLGQQVGRTCAFARWPAEELLLQAELRHHRQRRSEVQGHDRRHQHLHGGRHQVDRGSNCFCPTCSTGLN